MPDSPMTEAHKRALLVAFFLSKFDRKGVRRLGYSTFEEAFTGVGATLGVKAASVKHMRDSFDPYCSQVRVGWYQRKILPSRANVIQAYDELSEAAMAEIVQEVLANPQAAQAFTAPVTQAEAGEALLLEENPYALRLRTGEKAEDFFMTQFAYLDLFSGSVLEDMRKIGIGFDFRTMFPTSYLAVEVKGLLGGSGYISFTDKEWSVAQMLRQDYVLALVRFLSDLPVLELMPDPAAHLDAKMKTVESVSVCWNAKV